MKKIVLLYLSIFLFLAFTAKDCDAEKENERISTLHDTWRKTDALVKIKYYRRLTFKDSVKK
ncbi:hypothetical protein [Flavobacterium sp.]|uniref:hypothetical protein n=1 Tax=Flavobacterium sp. TaxID=239 RepID=UPI001B58F289|nr:hypothetical protein [Flavobacterium sp.]MBP6182456.1 hypothetical protein [Flavobacterium sp.]